MRNRTWPVFVFGAGILLLLIFLPGIAALRQSAQIYDDVRAIQDAHEHTQQALFEIERNVLQVSLAVRDFLLDNSPETAFLYRDRFHALEASIGEELQRLANAAPGDEAGMYDRLRHQMDEYWSTLDPVFQWTPAERISHATYFLRQQQRPRRRSVLAITDEILRLNAQNYRHRYENLSSSQQRFGKQLRVAVAVAFLLGVAVTGGTIIRISALERHSVSQRLATEKAEQELRSLSVRLRQAQEDERRSISRELHDEVGQMITGLRFELGALDRLRTGSGEEFSERLNEAKALAEQTMRTVRDIAVGLRPSVLDLGLEPALQWLARHFSRRTGTPASVEIDGQLPSLPDSHLTCVYRIAQEALTNSARYAHANKVEIAVRAKPGALELAVTDNGVGLPQNWSGTRGLGLLGIEERAREIGGTITVESQPGKGVRISVRLPVPEETTA